MNHLFPSGSALAVLLGAMACASTPTSAPATGPAPARPSAVAPTDIVFSGREIEIIRDYFRTHGDTAPVAGKKNKPLPPGIAKNLARGKPLPPGIAKRYLPGDLISALPPVRPGYERVIVDGRVLLVEIASQIVRDVLYDVVMP